MPTEVPPDNPQRTSDEPEPPAGRSVWWARLISHLPFAVLYAFSGLVGWLTARFFPYREPLVRENLSRAFPQFDEARLASVVHDYYTGFADMLVEIVKSVTLPARELRRRVRVVNIEAPRALMDAGQSVILVAAHQCNWEWMLLSLSLELGYPLDAAYKPLVDNWAEREMKKIRTRFGGRLVPARDLLADIIKRRDVVRAVAMVADQEPTTSEHKYWTRFLGRETAFYMGPEEIARVTRFPVFFTALRRTARGFYEMEFKLLAAAGENLPQGTLTERYARLVEDQIHAAPPDWPWSHKRWKLKRSVYQSRATHRPQA